MGSFHVNLCKVEFTPDAETAMSVNFTPVQSALLCFDIQSPYDDGDFFISNFQTSIHMNNCADNTAHCVKNKAFLRSMSEHILNLTNKTVKVKHFPNSQNFISSVIIGFTHFFIANYVFLTM